MILMSSASTLTEPTADTSKVIYSKKYIYEYLWSRFQASWPIGNSLVSDYLVPSQALVEAARPWTRGHARCACLLSSLRWYIKVLCLVKPKFHLARHITSRHVRSVEPLELVVSSVSSRAVRQARRLPKCMGSTRRTFQVVSRRDATSQEEFGLNWGNVCEQIA